MGGEARLERQHRAGPAQRPGASGSSVRSRHLLRDRQPGRLQRRAARARRRPGGRIGSDQRPAGSRRRRGRHRPRWLDRKRILRQALSPLPARPAGTGPTGHDVGRGRAPGHRDGCRPSAGRSAGPGRAVRSGAPGLPRARGVGRPWRPHRATVRLRCHDRDGVDLCRWAATRALGDRRGGHQGDARRAGSGDRCGRCRAQPGDRRRGGDRPGPSISSPLPAQRLGGSAPAGRPGRRKTAGRAPGADPS